MSYYSEATKNARIPQLQDRLVQVLLKHEKDPQLRECIELLYKVHQVRSSDDMNRLDVLLAHFE